VDVASGVVHTLTGTAANKADINQMAAVLHGRGEAVFADAGYTGAVSGRNTRTAMSPGTSQ
jgi:IS5 family transposase